MRDPQARMGLHADAGSRRELQREHLSRFATCCMVASSGKSFATSALRLQSAHETESGKPSRRTSWR
jgi:hypothetical protein